MLLGYVIHDKRRSLNLTQKDLAKNLCNQNTISKLEKHNDTPQINVLVKICKRLDLTLNQIFSDFSDDYQKEKVSVLDDIEKNILVGNLSDSNKLIEKDIREEDKAQFHLIEAILDLKSDKLEDALFNLDKVNLETKMDVNNIYDALAFLVKGLVYLEKNNNDVSNHYFETVYNIVKNYHDFSKAKGFEVLYLYKELGSAFAKLGRNELSAIVVRLGIEIVRKTEESYFLDEFYRTLAMINFNSESYDTYKNIAYYTALALQHDKIANEIKSWG